MPILGCFTLKKGSTFYIDENVVLKATIRQGYEDLPIDLDKMQIKTLIRGLNDNSKVGLAKYIKSYWIEFVLENDSIIVLGCNNKLFTAEKSIAFELKDERFLEQFWNEIEAKNDTQTK